jgi:hypothetical protein
VGIARVVAHLARLCGSIRPHRIPGDATRPTLRGMCRNITTLRGLEPQATTQEIEAAARQYIRKVSGVQSSSARTDPAVEAAVRQVFEATRQLLSELPARRQPPPTLPPLRRLAAASRPAPG